MVANKPAPDNLGTRHRALNARVNETAAKQVPFNAIKDEPEPLDTDKLYKIDLAAKYKNLEYIIDILKSGDSLYTSRALKKCQWIFKDEYSHIIDPVYLERNIFPFTSKKLKRKIVKTAAAHVKNPERAAKFFHYCIQEKMKNTAFTSLLYTTDDFKLEQLRNNKEPAFKALEEKDLLYLRSFVGKSLILLEALLNFISINWRISKTARDFKFFFAESEEEYLGIAEKFVSTYFGFQTDKFDKKLSDAIMKRHKHRVLAKPKFYVNTVDTDILVRNSTIDDAKIYAKALLPATVSEFWMRHHYTIYASVFKLIPHDKTYTFFKNYFAENYPNGVYEMHPEFYTQEYYKFMTLEEREEWAYRQIKSEKQILGVGKDYLWYKFIKFDVALEEIKRYINITENADKRIDMVHVLVESAKSNRDLEALFKYYNKRHMKELQKHREIFLNKVFLDHNVFEFDEKCWTAFYPIMLALSRSDSTNDSTKEEKYIKQIKNYKTIALMYHILHGKELPENLTNFLLQDFTVDLVESHLENTSEDMDQKLHEYFFTFYMSIIKESKDKTFEHDNFVEDVQPKLKRYYDNIEKCMIVFNENGTEYEGSDNDENNRKKTRRSRDPHEISGRSLLRDLKKDKNIVIDKLTRAQGEFEAFPIKINTFLKKLRIYFPHDDVTKVYLSMFQNIILDEALVHDNRHRSTYHVANAVRTGVNAIFQLADEETKTDFMNQYCPQDKIMDRKSLGIQHVRIQRAICRYACISRPPVPISSMLMYMQGDYVKCCLHIFDTYLAILPLPLCQQFVRLLIDAPVSIHKHAIRLAFQCYSPESLKEAISNIWKNTKNISLRSIIYKAFYNKVLDTKEQMIYDVLETLTRELHQDEEDVIFEMTVSKKTKLPENFISDYIEVVWDTIKQFKDIEPNISRKKDVVCYIRNNIHLLTEKFVSTIVYKLIDTMLLENKLQLTYSKEYVAALYKEKKWILVAHYMIHFSCPDHTIGKYVQLAQFIVKKNIESWDKMAYGVHFHQMCCWDFFNNLKTASLKEDYGDFENTIPIFQGMLMIIEAELMFYHSYLLTWELKLILITANVIKSYRMHCERGKELETVTSAVKKYGEEVGKIVSEFVGGNKYFMSYALQVKDKIKNYVEDLLSLIYVEIYQNGDAWKWKEHLYTAFIHLAVALVEVELSETYLLAIHLLPINCDECSSDKFKWLIARFQEFPSAEVQWSLFQRLQKYCHRRPSVPKNEDPRNIN